MIIGSSHWTCLKTWNYNQYLVCELCFTRGRSWSIEVMCTAYRRSSFLWLIRCCSSFVPWCFISWASNSAHLLRKIYPSLERLWNTQGNNFSADWVLNGKSSLNAAISQIRRSPCFPNSSIETSFVFILQVIPAEMLALTSKSQTFKGKMSSPFRVRLTF